jgi:hypothetical protein
VLIAGNCCLVVRIVGRYAETREVLCIFGPPITSDPPTLKAGSTLAIPGRDTDGPPVDRRCVSVVGWEEPTEAGCRPFWTSENVLLQSESDTHWRSTCALDGSAVFLINRQDGALWRLDTRTKKITVLPYNFPFRFPEPGRSKRISVASDGTWLWVIEDTRFAYVSFTMINLADTSPAKSWTLLTNVPDHRVRESALTALPLSTAFSWNSAFSAFDGEYPAAILTGGELEKSVGEHILDRRSRTTGACYLLLWSAQERSVRWIPLSSLKFSRSEHSALVLDRKLVVIGGRSRKQTPDDGATFPLRYTMPPCLAVEVLDLGALQTAIHSSDPTPSASASASASASTPASASVSSSQRLLSLARASVSLSERLSSLAWESWPSLPSMPPAPPEGDDMKMDRFDRRQFAAINGSLLAIDFPRQEGPPQLMKLEIRPENGERFWRSIELPVGTFGNPTRNCGPLVAFAVPCLD